MNAVVSGSSFYGASDAQDDRSLAKGVMTFRGSLSSRSRRNLSLPFPLAQDAISLCPFFLLKTQSLSALSSRSRRNLSLPFPLAQDVICLCPFLSLKMQSVSALSSRSRRNLSLALSRSTVVEEDGGNSMIIFRIKFEFEVHMCTYKFCKFAGLKFPVSGRSIDR